MKILVMLFVCGLTLAATAAELPVAEVESLGTPVKSARIWTTAISPNPRGGFNFIAQFYNNNEAKKDPEWLVLDLNTGKATRQQLPGYANTNYQIENQLRAANGRTFFSVLGNRLCYYEPKDESIKTLGPLLPEEKPGQPGATFFYRLIIGPDGMLYAATQSNDGFTHLAIVNPDTLESKVFTKLGGEPRKDALTYGYYVEADPPWVYILVGKGHWALVALNTDTGEQRTLSQVDPPYNMSLDRKAHIRVSVPSALTEPVPDGPDIHREGDLVIHENVIYNTAAKTKTSYFWCVDGALVPASLSADPATLPFLPRPAKPIELKQTRALPMGPAPEIDIEGLRSVKEGTFQIRWRPAGSKSESDWKAVSFAPPSLSPINLESLIGLPDGSLMGNAVQYNGFFRYTPAGKTTTWYGKHGPSQPVLALAGGTLYFSGYPSGVLYVFDPRKPWKSATDPKLANDPSFNPYSLGTFASADAHYPYFLIPTDNGRLYFGGRRERAGQGAAVGYYDLAAKTFAGHHTNLSFLQPRGMVVLPQMKRIVLSGQLIDDPNRPNEKPGEAQLVIYDLDLNEQKRITVKPGLMSTGALYPTSRATQFVGVIEQKDGNAAYLYDLEKGAVVNWVALEQPIENLVRHPKEGWYLGCSGGRLVKLNPLTLEVTPLATMDKRPDRLVWQGNDLYGTAGAELLKIKWAHR